MTALLYSLLLISAAYALASGALRLHARGSRLLSARALSRFCVALLALAVSLPWLMRLAPAHGVFDPPAKLWAAPSMREIGRRARADVPTLTLGDRRQALPSGTRALELAAWAAGLFWAGLALRRASRLGRDAFRLRRLLARAYHVRAVGRARLVASDEAAVPFAVLTPRAAWVVLPNAWMARPMRELRLVVAHELEHHRQGHTLQAWLAEVFSLAFALHPQAPAWNRLLSRAQEFSCDEALIGHRRFSSREYGRCLYEAAQSASSSFRPLAGATGMANGEGGLYLKGRIRMLSQYEDRKSLSSGRRSFIASLLVLFAFTGAAWAAQASVGDHRVSMEKARQWAQDAARGSEFPVTVNEAVLEQLNHYVGTPDGREFTRASLGRLEEYRPMLEAKLKEHGVPRELLAIGMVESGYRNLPARANRFGGAGVWQFIAATARAYGMKVNDQVDERNVVPLETSAAFTYLKKGEARFDDWLLSILGYNAGEIKVEKAIATEGTRDPWKLAQAGVETDPDYLAKVMAMVLILKNPVAALN